MVNGVCSSFRGPMILFLELLWQLTTVGNSSSRGPATPFWPLRTPGIYKVNRHACKQKLIHIIRKKTRAWRGEVVGLRPVQHRMAELGFALGNLGPYSLPTKTKKKVEVSECQAGEA